jgi:hypothetical protein
VEDMQMPARGAGLFTSMILKLRALSSRFCRQSKKTMSLSGLSETRAAITVSTIASLLRLIYLLSCSKLPGKRFSFAAGLDVTSANRLSLVCSKCRVQRHCLKLHLVAVTLPGSCQRLQSREHRNIYVVINRLSYLVCMTGCVHVVVIKLRYVQGFHL